MGVCRYRGLIPARAGKTKCERMPRAVGAAHPRAGGENPWHARSVICAHGSSPRGRGKHSIVLTFTLRPRLIPARAGKTLATTNNTLPVEAHPRAGGENLQDIFDLVSAAGSSPRGRGKPPRGCHRPGARRLIPARAGKTCRHRYLPESPRAHPRAGGENPAMLGSSLQLFGSSPRGRGKRAYSTPTIFSQRLIPARAGKTAARPGR